MKVVKTIKYKDITIADTIITIPEYIQFIAIDKEGLINGFVNRPVALEDKGFWDDPEACEFIELGLAILGDTDWKTTLIKLSV